MLTWALEAVIFVTNGVIARKIFTNATIWVHITTNNVIYFWFTKWRAINGKHVKICHKIFFFSLYVKIPRRQRRKSSNENSFFVTNVQYVNLNLMIQCQPNLFMLKQVKLSIFWYKKSYNFHKIIFWKKEFAWSNLNRQSDFYQREIYICMFFLVECHCFSI